MARPRSGQQDGAVVGPGGPGGRGRGHNGGHGQGGGKGHPAAPRYGEVRVDGPGFALYARLFTGAPVPTVSTGWVTVPRPDDESMTQYQGHEGDRESVQIILDGFRHDRGVERDVARLKELCQVPAKEKHPPVFTVRGGGLRLAGKRVVMETLEWGDVQERRDPDDVVTRQVFTLGLLRYERADQVKLFKRGKGSWPKYTAKKGDTLKRIAHEMLKGRADNPNNAREYAHTLSILNDIRDVNRKLKPGTEIKLP